MPVTRRDESQTEPDTTQPFHHHPQLRPGRKPVHEIYPEIVTTVTDFIQSHGFSAQSRRRSSVGNSMGVTLAEIQTHIIKHIPELKARGLSRTTVHELMVAPRKRARNAQRYRELVQSRVPGKDNSLRKAHEHGHYASAQVKYAKEFCQAFPEDTVHLSCDDMNKVNVGVLAVSRYHQVGRFFPLNEKPCSPDQDFPFKNSKIIIPSGYMVLSGAKPTKADRMQSRSLTRPQGNGGRSRPSQSWSPPAQRGHSSGRFGVDKLARLHHVVPHTGALHVLTVLLAFTLPPVQPTHQISQLCSGKCLPSRSV